jgi:hypothetical protein
MAGRAGGILAVSTHAYPAAAIAGDYLRAGAGLCLVGLPLVVAETAAAVTALLAAFAVVFALHGARTVSRHVARIELSEDGIRSRGLTAAEIRWSDLQRLQLAHYSTRRDRSGGWLQLRLTGAGQRLRIDSPLQDFTALAARAVVAARENRIALDPATASNLEALGLTPATVRPSSGSAGG